MLKPDVAAALVQGQGRDAQGCRAHASLVQGVHDKARLRRTETSHCSDPKVAKTLFRAQTFPKHQQGAPKQNGNLDPEVLSRLLSTVVD